MSAIIKPEADIVDPNYITIFTQYGPIGKELDVDPDTGLMTKHSSALFFGTGVVHHVPDTRAFHDLLTTVTSVNNKAFMLGYIKGTEDGEQFQVTTEKDYLQRGGTKDLPYIVLNDGINDGMKLVARLKRHTVTSSWLLLDRDTPEGMPDVYANLSRAEWLDYINIFTPGFAQCAKVILPSSSGRIIVDGVQKVTNNFHCYIQIKNPDDMRRFRDVMCQLSYDRFLTYTLEKGGKHRFIFDRTTFSQERLCYESMPVSLHPSITIGEVQVEMIAGGVLDTERILAPNIDRPGLHKGIGSGGSGSSGSGGSGNNEQLDWNQVIETKAYGLITVQQFHDDLSMADDDGKLRDCQSFNRPESTSWNGYLQRTDHTSSKCNFRDRNQVYFFDNGDELGFITATDISVMLAGIGNIEMVQAAEGVVVDVADVAVDVAQPVDNFDLLNDSIKTVRLNNFNDAQKFIDGLVTSGLSKNDQLTILASFKEHFANARDVTRMFKTASNLINAAEKKSVAVEQVSTLVNSGAYLPLEEVLSWESFPIVKRGEEGEVVSVTTHYKNTEHILNSYGIAIGYNQITKRPSISHTEFNSDGFEDMASEAAIGRVLAQISLNRLEGFTDATVMMHLNILTMDRQYNPVVEHLSSIQWDGVDRIDAFCNLIGVDPQVEEVRNYIVRKWCIQACAASDHAIHTPLVMRHKEPALPKFEYIMVLQGHQGLKKTKFVEAMLPQSLRRFFKDGVLLDPGNKDSVSLFIKNWIVELGELDATFKRSEISHLKAFMSNQRDAYRPPYGKGNVDYQRRTAVIATVNPERFLRDTTGNRRFWTLKVHGLSMPGESGIDMDQLWGQFWSIYMSGEQWWPEDKWQGRVDQLSNGVLYMTDKQQEIAHMLSDKYESFDGDDTGWEEKTVNEIMSVINFIDRKQWITNTELGKTLGRINRNVNGEARNKRCKHGMVWKMPKIKTINGNPTGGMPSQGNVRDVNTIKH